MTSEIKIALDCMGGDDAPTMVVRGADLAVERQPDIFFHLVHVPITKQNNKKYLLRA